jgi:hypothetical protein
MLRYSPDEKEALEKYRKAEAKKAAEQAPAKEAATLTADKLEKQK